MSRPASRPLHVTGLSLAVPALIVALICLSDPRPTWLYMLDIFTVPLLSACVALTAVLALLRQRLAAVVALAACLVLFAAAAPQILPPRPQAKDGAPALHVVFANLYFRNPDPGRLAAWAEAQRADIVVTAETTPRLWEMLRARMDAHYPYANQQGEIAIFARYPFPYQRHPDGHFGVAAMRTPLGPLRLIGAHFDHPDSHREPRRPGFDARLRQRLDAGDPAATLLVGDFNSDMSAYMLKGLARDYRLTALPALNGSWPSPLPGLLRLSIDNALAGADWRLSGRVVGPDIGSDHRPIAFTLQRN